MQEQEIFESLKKMISDQFGVDEELIKKESSFMEDLAADSLDIVEFIMNIEEKFGVKISDDDIETFNNVEDVVKYILDNKKI